LRIILSLCWFHEINRFLLSFRSPAAEVEQEEEGEEEEEQEQEQAPEDLVVSDED